MRTLLLSAALALTAGLWSPAPPAAAQSPAPAPAPASIAGKWTLTVNLASPDAVSTLDLKLEGTKVTGTVSATTDLPITGEYVDGKLSFVLDYRGQATVVFTGALKEDGTLAGTMEYGEGPIPWRAERVKTA